MISDAIRLRIETQVREALLNLWYGGEEPGTSEGSGGYTAVDVARCVTVTSDLQEISDALRRLARIGETVRENAVAGYEPTEDAKRELIRSYASKLEAVRELVR